MELQIQEGKLMSSISYILIAKWDKRNCVLIMYFLYIIIITVFLKSAAYFCFSNIPSSFRPCGLVLALSFSCSALLWMWHDGQSFLSQTTGQENFPWLSDLKELSSYPTTHSIISLGSLQNFYHKPRLPLSYVLFVNCVCLLITI